MTDKSDGFILDRMKTPIGIMLIVADEDGNLRALDWAGFETRLHRLLALHYGPGAAQLRDGNASSIIKNALEAYFSGALTAIDALSVKTGGTAFQREVWAALRRIRPGETWSYGRLAKEIGRPDAVRAVGLANGANPIGLVVPCHRVIGANAKLTGYAGGLERKRWLLQHEGADLPLFAGRA